MKPMGTIPAHFAADDAGRLMIGGEDVETLAARAGDTPLFVYDFALIKARIARFRAAFPDSLALHYAIKANPMPALLKAIAPLVDGLDVASSGEMALALTSGGRHISFAGPGKRDRELEAAIVAGVTLNLESEGEAHRALAIAERVGTAPKLAVRVKGELLTSLDAASLDPTDQLTRDGQSHLFDRIDWLRRVLRHSRSTKTPLIARAASEGALAWLFLKYGDNAQFKGLANWYNFAYRPIFAGDPDDSRKLLMLTAIATRLRKMRSAPASISLSPVPRGDGSSDLLSRAFKRSGWFVFSNQASTSWTAHVSGLSFEDYWAARPGQLRSTYKRKNGKADFDVTIHDQFDEAAWEEFEAVYADSWKPEEGSPAFLRETAVFEGAAGCLRLGICRLEGVAVAAQYWTVEGGTAYIHKLAHRESARELSPGTILSRALFQQVIDQDAVDVIDFGTGDEPYKADWMDARAPLDRIDAYNPRRASGLTGAARAFISALVARARER